MNISSLGGEHNFSLKSTTFTSIFSPIDFHNLAFFQTLLYVLLCHLFSFITSNFTLSSSLPLFYFLYKCIFPYSFLCFHPTPMPQQYQFLLYFIFILSNYMWVCGGRIIPEPLQMSLPCQSLRCGSWGDQWDPGLRVTQAAPAYWSCFFSVKTSIKMCLEMLLTYVSSLPLFLCQSVYSPLSHFHCKLPSSVISLTKIIIYMHCVSFLLSKQLSVDSSNY